MNHKIIEIGDLIGCDTCKQGDGWLRDAYKRETCPAALPQDWRKEAEKLVKEYGDAAYLVSEESHPRETETLALSNVLAFITRLLSTQRKELVDQIKNSRAAIFSGLKEKDGKLYGQIEITDGSEGAFLVTEGLLARLAEGETSNKEV